MSSNTLPQSLIKQLNALGINTNFDSSNSNTQREGVKELKVDTSRFAGCNFEEFKLMVQEGLKGSDKEFFQRIQKRGVESIFRTFDDGNGTLSKSEAQMISSIGLDQMSNKNSSGFNLDSLIKNIGSISLPKIDFSSIINSVQSTSKKSVSSSGRNTSSAVNFALQYNGRSAADMSGVMSSTGFHAGAWCADFVYFALKNAGTVPAGYDSINHAYCPSIAQWARQSGRAFSDPSQAKPGDLLIMNSEGHIGIVTKVDSQGIHTIEGNTTNDSGVYNNGYVNDRIRSFNCVSTFVRI